MAKTAYHYSEPVGAGPVTLNLNGNDHVSIDGTLTFGDPITINVQGTDHLDASGGFDDVSGSINLADHAHLFVTGRLDFGYGGYGGNVIGGAKSLLTNNGMIEIGAGNLSVAVNGTGTLGFHGYHNQRGFGVISAPVSDGQTVLMDTGNMGLAMALTDVADFHGLIELLPNTASSAVSVSLTLYGVKADGLTVGKNSVTLTEGGKAVDTLRLANAGAVPITATYGIATSATTTGTELTFHTNPIV